MTNKKNKTTESRKGSLSAKSISLKKKTTLSALEKALGNVSMTCKHVGISRETFYRWMKEDEEFKNSVDDIYEANIDFAESSLLKNIREGKETSIIFYLKTKGKQRGYVEKTEFDGNFNVNAKYQQVDISNLSDDEIVTLAKLDEKVVKDIE